MPRLSVLVVSSLVVAHLAGCSSCMREEEKPETKVIEPPAKPPPLTGKYRRFQLHHDGAAGEDASTN